MESTNNDETTREGQVSEQTMMIICIYRNYAHDRQVREQMTVDIITWKLHTKDKSENKQ